MNLWFISPTEAVARWFSDHIIKLRYIVIKGEYIINLIYNIQKKEKELKEKDTYNIYQ